MNKIFTVIAFLVFSAFLLNAQTANDSIQQSNLLYQDAEQILLKKQFKKAARLFERSIKVNPSFCPSYRGLAACYTLMGQHHKAIQTYEEILNINPFFSRALYYQLAQAYHQVGTYTSALLYYQEFVSLQERPAAEFGPNGTAERDLEADYLGEVMTKIRAVHTAMDSIKFQNIKRVINLGSSINTKGDEYFPFLTNDQKTLYYTTRKSEKHDENLYTSNWLKKQKEWDYGQSVSDFNTNENEGMSTLVRDGKRIYFTACNREEIQGPCDLWEGILEEDEVLETSSLKGGINSDKWDSQAAINCDGSMIYFASTRPGGFGGSDIWVSYRLSNGYWSDPVNLGPVINTKGDEESPFITNDGQTLYFSSNGHLGLGEEDIFMARLDKLGAYDKPVNLGPPVNSSYRELGFFLSADGKTGYFASNREEGFGGMDIYKFDLSEQLYSYPMTFVEGFVLDSVLNVPVQTIVNIPGRAGVPTDEDGRFFLCLSSDMMLFLQVDEQRLFKNYEKTFHIPEWNNQFNYRIELLLQPKFSFIAAAEKIVEKELTKKSIPVEEVLHTVYFESGLDQISFVEKERLEEFIKQMSVKAVDRVEVRGYTDQRGTDSYNLRLSESRAKNTVSFLKDYGVKVNPNDIFIGAEGEIIGDSVKKEHRKVEIRFFVITKK